MVEIIDNTFRVDSDGQLDIWKDQKNGFHVWNRLFPVCFTGVEEKGRKKNRLDRLISGSKKMVWVLKWASPKCVTVKFFIFGFSGNVN